MDTPCWLPANANGQAMRNKRLIAAEHTASPISPHDSSRHSYGSLVGFFRRASRHTPSFRNRHTGGGSARLLRLRCDSEVKWMTPRHPEGSFRHVAHARPL